MLFLCDTQKLGFLKRPWSPQGAHGAFIREPQKGFLFWTLIYFWDKIEKVRDSFKVMMFFVFSCILGQNDKIGDNFKVTDFFYGFYLTFDTIQ